VSDTDVVILAGDIHPGIKAIGWIVDQYPEVPEIYVPGNHEYYRHAIPKHTLKLKELANGTHIHRLANDCLLLNKVVFLGCTLWTDFKLFGDPRVAGYFATQYMNDYKRIRVSPSYRKLR
jgi:predicted phosphohydrolase